MTPKYALLEIVQLSFQTFFITDINNNVNQGDDIHTLQVEIVNENFRNLQNPARFVQANHFVASCNERLRA